MYCEDSRITSTDERKVVVSIFDFVDSNPSPLNGILTNCFLIKGKPAYVLYYKRVKS